MVVCCNLPALIIAVWIRQDSGLRLLTSESRLTPRQYQQLSSPKLLVDVRPANELDICRLPDELKVLNVPLGALRSEDGRETVRRAAQERRGGDERVTGQLWGRADGTDGRAWRSAVVNRQVTGQLWENGWVTGQLCENREVTGQLWWMDRSQVSFWEWMDHRSAVEN